MGTVTQLHPHRDRDAAPTIAAAVDAWIDDLAHPDRRSRKPASPHTQRQYRLAVDAVTNPEMLVAELDTEPAAAALQTAFHRRWDQAAAATWNARLHALRSFIHFSQHQRWLSGDPLAGIDRAAADAPEPRARPRTEIQRLLTNRKHPLRERTLWAMLYSTCARADEVLGLDVDHLDLANRQARTVGKGGTPRILTWDRDTARLLSRLVGDRRRGPVFLTARSAKGARRGTVDAADLDPTTGRGRLGYDHAAELLKAATATLTGGPWTPHDLRHSGLTHAAEDGVGVELLMAKSGHQDIRSLARYARPSAEAAQREIDRRRNDH